MPQAFRLPSLIVVYVGHSRERRLRADWIPAYAGMT